jgi:hypothetical protein
VHELVVTYGTESNGQTSGRYQPVAPGLLAVTGTGGQQVVPVISRKWEVTYPETSELTGVQGAYEPVGTLRQLSWLGRWQDMARIPDWKESASRLGVLLGIVLCGVILGLLYRGLGLRGCVVAGLVILILPVGLFGLGMLVPSLAGVRQELSYALSKGDMEDSSQPARPTSVHGSDSYGGQSESGSRGSVRGRTQFEFYDDSEMPMGSVPMNAPMAPQSAAEPAREMDYRELKDTTSFENSGAESLALSDEMSESVLKEQSQRDEPPASQAPVSRFDMPVRPHLNRSSELYQDPGLNPHVSKFAPSSHL